MAKEREYVPAKVVVEKGLDIPAAAKEKVAHVGWERGLDTVKILRISQGKDSVICEGTAPGTGPFKVYFA